MSAPFFRCQHRQRSRGQRLGRPCLLCESPPGRTADLSRIYAGWS
jgi:hypothetical protein